MNRLLLDAAEINADGVVRLTDHRARHLCDVLHVTPGKPVRAGILDGAAGMAEVLSVTPDPTVSLCFHADPDPLPAEPRVDLLLGLPRPRALKRLWPQLAALGVARIFPVRAERVEKYYSATQWMDPAHVRPLFIEGAEQAGATRLPVLESYTTLAQRLGADFLCRYGEDARWVGDPGTACALPAFPQRDPLLVAVGPERGWSEAEREKLHAAAFQPVRLGPRMLRADTACVALVAMAMHQGATVSRTG